MKKLIKDSFTKTAFSFNNKIYKQTDMEYPWYPVLVNIFMTELVKTIAKNLFDKV